MKQKRIGDILYVFDVTPYTISEDTEATTIKVQQECYDGFVALNPDLADKIVKYNYHMFTVNKQEWADYVNEPDPEPVPGYTITLTGTGLSDETITIKVGGETVPVQETYESVLSNEFFEIFPLQDIANYTLASENMQFENDPNNYHWFESPQEDMTIELNYTEPERQLPAQGTVYNFTGYAHQDSSEPSSTGTITYEGEWEQDTSYVYGTASATFVGSEDVQSVTVYMTKDDLFLSLDGNRVQVYTIQSDQLVSFGYGELTEYTE